MKGTYTNTQPSPTKPQAARTPLVRLKMNSRLGGTQPAVLLYPGRRGGSDTKPHSGILDRPYEQGQTTDKNDKSETTVRCLRLSDEARGDLSHNFFHFFSIR